MVMHSLRVRNPGQDLRLKAVTAVRAGVGLLATLDAFETSGRYYYLSRDMDYLAYVGSLLRSAGGSSAAPRPLTASRESVVHDLAARYERSQGLGEGRPLLVDTGFHGNVLRILLQRWPDARGRLLESHCGGIPSSRVALRLAGLLTDHPFDRRRWVVRFIEDVPHEFSKTESYIASAGSTVPVRAPEMEAAAAEFRELVREEFTNAGAAEQLYADVYPCLRILADWLRHTQGRYVIEFRPDSFGPDSSSAAPFLWTHLVMALRDLCHDISWRGRGTATSVRVRSEGNADRWQPVAARISAETGVAVAVSSHFPGPRPTRIVDVGVRAHPQSAVGVIVEELDRSSWQLSSEDLGDCVGALRSMGLLSAAIADLIDTIRLRPAGWDLSRLHPLLGFLSS
jgi:hypothetical protein